MRKLLAILIIIVASCNVWAQSDVLKLTDSIAHRFMYQLQVFPQEKIFAHIDKNYYISGEKIWFRTHLVKAYDHVPNSASRYIYTELINPADSLISRVKIMQDNKGLCHGYIQLPEHLPEGNYVVKAYTNFMQNLDDAYFFRKVVRIGNPASSRVKSNIIHDGESLRIYFTDKRLNKIKPKNIRIRYGNGRTRSLKLDADSIGTLSPKLSDTREKPVMYIEFEQEGIVYSEYIDVPSLNDDYDVSFFPEGGNLLEGILSSIAFKGIGSDGLAENITGEIVDEAGNVLSSFEPIHSGMGIFSIFPVSGEKYYAVCRNEKNIEKRFELPKALPDSYSLKSIYNNDKLYVSVLNSATTTSKKDLYILIHSRGIVEHFLHWNDQKKAISVDTKDLPPGIVQILLLDSDLNTLSERLFFNTYNMQAATHLMTNKKVYKQRQPVAVGIDIKDIDGKPLPGNFSVSVTNDNDLPPDTVMNIVSYLLLSSELKGYIESPEQYIGDDRNTRFKQDLLMLTQGWRRYDVPSVAKGNYTYPRHLLEIGQVISGTVKSGFFKVKGTKNNRVSILSPNTGYFDITETDDNGHFFFRGFEHPDSTTFFVQALSQKGRRSVELYLNKDSFPAINESSYIPFEKSYIETVANKDNIFENYTIKANQKYTMENGIRMVYLPEVKVAAQKKEKSSSIYMSVGEKLFSQEEIERAPNIESLLHRIPGTQVRKDVQTGNVKVVFNRNIGLGGIGGGNSSALFIVDDMIMESDFNPDIIPVQDIEEISVIKGAESAILGMRGSNGAVVIKTKTGGGITRAANSFNIGTITPLGYQTPVEFYSPKYETQKQIDDVASDLRTTIYWKPDVVLTDDGKASFEFYTADVDRRTSYSIILQGVTNDGQIIYKTDKITVE